MFWFTMLLSLPIGFFPMELDFQFTWLCFIIDNIKELYLFIRKFKVRFYRWVVPLVCCLIYCLFVLENTTPSSLYSFSFSGGIYFPEWNFFGNFVKIYYNKLAILGFFSKGYFWELLFNKCFAKSYFRESGQIYEIRENYWNSRKLFTLR